MKQCQLIVEDEVNAKFLNLDPATRRQCNDALKFMLHSARHTPAFKLGRWDGTVSYFNINGTTYVNVLDKILPIIEQNGYEIDLVDNRPGITFTFPQINENYLKDNVPTAVWPKGHKHEGEPIILRDYQVDAINNFLINPQSLQVISTGGGKTVLSATLSHICETYGRTIIIVPNKSLVTQTERDYKLLGLDVGVFYGERKEYGHKHTICTWQSLDILAKGQAKKRRTTTEEFSDFIEDVVCVMVDECHTISGPVLSNMLNGAFAHIPIRWGFTGTIPKEDHLAMSLLCSIGPVVGKVTARELMDKEVLAECHIEMVKTQETAVYKDFHEEYEYLVTDKYRLEWLSDFIRDKAKTGNTLVLINRIKTGDELLRLMPEATLVNGSTKEKDRKESYDSISESDNKILIATFGVASTGIDIPRIFNLILIEPGKSFVRVIQSIGRGVRKAKDKDFVQVYDVCSRCKYSNRHANERKKYYKEAQYPFTEKKYNY